MIRTSKPNFHAIANSIIETHRAAASWETSRLPRDHLEKELKGVYEAALAHAAEIAFDRDEHAVAYAIQALKAETPEYPEQPCWACHQAAGSVHVCANSACKGLLRMSRDPR